MSKAKRTHDEIVANSGWLMYGARHYIDRMGARRWAVTIPGIYPRAVFTTRTCAEREVTHIMQRIARETEIR